MEPKSVNYFRGDMKDAKLQFLKDWLCFRILLNGDFL